MAKTASVKSVRINKKTIELLCQDCNIKKSR